MTIEQVLNCSAAQLEAMTDSELREHFKDKLEIMRPSTIDLSKEALTKEDLFSAAKSVSTRAPSADTLKKQRIAMIAAKHGISMKW